MATARKLRGRVGQLLRYATVSAIATAVGLAILGVLVGVADIPAGWANVIATSIGTVPSFELNRRWVWRRQERSWMTQAIPFGLIALLELGASTASVHAAASWSADHHWSKAATVIFVLGANVVAYGGLWVGQFVVCDRLLFRKRTVTVMAKPNQPEEALCR